MSDEDLLGHIGSLQARWLALVAVLVDKGLITREEVMAALDREVEAALQIEEEREEESAAMGLDDEEDDELEHDEDDDGT